MKQKRFLKAFVRAVSDTTEGLLTGVVGSTAAVDRYGEVIDQNTWDLKHFKKNPVILWAHNLTLGEDRPPIGKATKVKVENDALQFDIQFDMADPFAADIFRKYKEGFLSAFSVGFIPHKIQRSDSNDTPPVLMDNELLELSAVPVPANPEALNTLRARSFKTRSWETMVKEVEAEDKADEEDEDKEVATEDPKEPETPKEPGTPEAPKEGEADVDAIADKVAAKLLPHIKSSITEIVKSGVKPEIKDVGGDGSSPEKTKLGVDAHASNKTVAVIRQATKMLQSALAEVNADRKASR